jgi:hypothetical protein
VAAQGQSSEPAERVDFGYAFAPPHRMTVARPEASEKTLLDVEPGLLTMSWSYDDLRNMPLATFKTPRTEWHVKVQPQIDGQPFVQSTWKRGGGFLPLLENDYRDPAGSVRLEAIGGVGAALVKITAYNADSRRHSFAVRCEVRGGWVAHNAAWMDTGRDPDTLLAGQSERPDRVLLFGAGGAEYTVDAKAMTLVWTLAPGERREGWLIRPYQIYQADLVAFRNANWQTRFDAARAEWQDPVGRAVPFDIPDTDVKNAFYASIGDVFHHARAAEEWLHGHVVRHRRCIARPIQPSPAWLQSPWIQTGYHGKRPTAFAFHLDMQEENGEVGRSEGLSPSLLGCIGFKA